MGITWQNLRSLGNSQNTAFEELCCQLASYEAVPPGSKFLRKGVPDAGVECFWRLPDGTEWAWQAKYFQDVGKAQWAQLDKSVRTALKKHSSLTSYTVCLPLDRRDPRIRGRKDLMEQWDERVEKWQSWAREEKMSVEFRYWGEHELWERLSREEHCGRYFFWFNKELFSSQWFANLVAEGVANAGPRYTPEIHVGLPIADLFDGVGRTAAFYARVTEAYGEMKRAYTKIQFDTDDDRVETLLADLGEDARRLFPLLENVGDSGVNSIEFETATKSAFQVNENAWEVSQLLDERKRSVRPSAGGGLVKNSLSRRNLIAVTSDTFCRNWQSERRS